MKAFRADDDRPLAPLASESTIDRAGEFSAGRDQYVPLATESVQRWLSCGADAGMVHAGGAREDVGEEELLIKAVRKVTEEARDGKVTRTPLELLLRQRDPDRPGERRVGRSMRPSASRTGSAIDSARGERTIPRGVFTKIGSPNASRRRRREWLSAGWLTPRRRAARVTWRVSSTARKTVRRLRSTRARSRGGPSTHHKPHA
jgi:hypothetical protein